jgi:hypothetical protein
VAERNALGVLYTIKFTIINDIPEGGSIVFVFATGYSITNIEPKVKSANLVATSGQTITYTTVTANRSLTISNLAKVAAGQEVEFEVNRVDNAGITTPNDFNIRTTDTNGRNIDLVSNASTSLSTAFVTGEANFTKVEFNPSSKGARNTDFEFVIRADDKLPIGSNVQITFPTEFSEMASGSCEVNFKVTLCTVSGLFVNFTLGQDIAAKQEITINAWGLAHIPTVDQTSSFVINVSYQNQVID